jgi:hypothetical protein
MNLRQGAFRIWVLVAVLWVGLVGWSWSDTFEASFQNKCWLSDFAWSVSNGMSDDWIPPKTGPEEPDDNECWVMEEYPREIVPTAFAHAASLPGGLLAIWFVGTWVWRGFRPEPNDRPGIRRRIAAAFGRPFERRNTG